MKPVTRKEAYWAAMADDSITPPEPQTTEECILAAMSGNYPADKIKPQTREQELMKQAAVRITKDVVWTADTVEPKDEVINVIIPDGVTKIADGAFNGFNNLESVTFPQSLKHIGMGCFNNVKSLANINIPASVTVISESAFAGCSSLKTVDVPDTVTVFKSNAFAVCGFEKFVIPENVTEIGAGCFGGCTRLSVLTIKSPNITIADGALGGCGTEVGGITIEIYAPKNSISGAPWGATNAEIIWNG